MRIIDTHTHVGSKDRGRYPLVTEERSPATSWFLDHGVSVHELLDLMDGADVTAAILVQALGSHGTDNSYVIDSVPAGDGRLLGIGTVDLAGADPGGQARHAIEVDRLSGLRLFDRGTGVLSSDGTLAVARQAADLHVPLLLFTGVQQIPEALRLVEALPGLMVVLDHCANPDLGSGPPWEGASAVFALADHPTIFLKVSSMTFDAAPEGSATDLVTALVARFGADRLVWGSDFSHTFDRPYRSLVDLAHSNTAGLTSVEQEKVLSGTACRLWPALARVMP